MGLGKKLERAARKLRDKGIALTDRSEAPVACFNLLAAKSIKLCDAQGKEIAHADVENLRFESRGHRHCLNQFRLHGIADCKDIPAKPADDAISKEVATVINLHEATQKAADECDVVITDAYPKLEDRVCIGKEVLLQANKTLLKTAAISALTYTA